jgi:hypothetical protein
MPATWEMFDPTAKAILDDLRAISDAANDKDLAPDVRAEVLRAVAAGVRFLFTPQTVKQVDKRG